MAKKEVSEQKANLYLLAIVAIVAVVGIVVLVLNSGGVSVSSSDLSGQAVSSSRSSALSCSTCPDNCIYTPATGKYSCMSVNQMINTAVDMGAKISGLDEACVCYEYPEGTCNCNKEGCGSC